MADDERSVPILVLLGGLHVGVGWLIGIYRLWTSDTWGLRHKLVGTLLLPGGGAVVAVPLSLGKYVQRCGTTTSAPGTQVQCSAEHVRLPAVGMIAMPVWEVSVACFWSASPSCVAVYLERARRRVYLDIGSTHAHFLNYLFDRRPKDAKPLGGLDFEQNPSPKCPCAGGRRRRWTKRYPRDPLRQAFKLARPGADALPGRPAALPAPWLGCICERHGRLRPLGR